MAVLDRSPILASAPYLGATAAELELAGLARHAMAPLRHRMLLRHHGRMVLRRDSLTLEQWHGLDDLVVSAVEIRSVRRRFTALYGRVRGGLAGGGTPIIIDSLAADELYIVIDGAGRWSANDGQIWEQRLQQLANRPADTT